MLTNNTDKYWQILTNTDKYWQILTKNTDLYWQILTNMDKYCQILTNTDKYRKLLRQILRQTDFFLILGCSLVVHTYSFSNPGNPFLKTEKCFHSRIYKSFTVAFSTKFMTNWTPIDMWRLFLHQVWWLELLLVLLFSIASFFIYLFPFPIKQLELFLACAERNIFTLSFLALMFRTRPWPGGRPEKFDD